jgi:colanic acid biosynthesis glycosyl transferase WcaI
MKILYLSPYFWPEEIGSAPYCAELAMWLQQRGHDVRAVCFRPHYPSAQHFKEWCNGSHDRESYNGIDIERVATSERGAGSFFSRVRNDLAYLRRLIKLAFSGTCRGTSLIIVYVPSILGVYGAWLLRLTTGARIIAVVHDIESGLASSLGIAHNRALIGAMRQVERIGLNLVTHVVVLTENMKRRLVELGCTRQINVVPIWVSLPKASPAVRGRRVKVMYSGNFGKKQALHQLLPLFRRLSREAASIDIVMRGDGSEKECFKDKVRAMGIENISFLPLVPTDELMDSLQAAHIHLVPQAANVADYAMPSKLFSIMASGRPFVCIAEKNSVLDVLAQETGAGICAAPGFDDLLYDQVIKLAADFDCQNRMGEAGRRYVEAHMSKETIMRVYGDLIDGCCGK